MSMADRYRDRAFSPDDQNWSQQGWDRQDSQHGGAQPESDPLAELARLIGQADPYSNFGREQQSGASRLAQANTRHEADRGADDNYSSYEDEPPPGPPSWMRHQQQGRQPQAPHYDEQDEAPPHQPSYQDDPSAYPGQSDFGAPQRAPAYGQAYNQQAYDQRSYDPNAYDQRGYEQQGYDQGHGAPDQQAHEGRYEDVLYGSHPGGQPHSQYGLEHGYREHDYEQPYADEQAQPRPRRMMSVIAVAVLAVIGTAGAYAYRSFTSGPSSRSGEPPIIKADGTPTKIVPASAQSGDKAGDRVTGKNDERVVSREEQPVDIDARSGGPRVVFPPLTQNPSPPSGNAVSPANRPTGPGVANGVLNGEEPRRIRTLTIRPDGSEDPIAQAAATGVAPGQSAPPKPQTASRAVPAPANAPIALTPQAAPAPDPKSRVASLSSPPPAAGAYVQLSSQKTEADALTSYRAIQSKYSSILGSRQPTVRRADLGDKGVYYRALVGPFASTEEATQFCVNLQSAGGKCIVQRN